MTGTGSTGPHAAQRVEKPWGYELIWAHSEHYVGKLLHINAGEMLSLQYHRVKDETICVLNGVLRLLVDEGGTLVERRLGPGDSYRVLPHVRHRMIADADCDVMEVSTPELDDVVRIEDAYGRAG